MNTLSDIQPGWNVYGSEGDKIGSVVSAQPNYFVLEKGLFFTKDIYVPADAVEDIDETDRAVYLNVAKHDIERRDWLQPPTDRPVEEGYARTHESYAQDASTRDAPISTTSTDSLRVPVHEEELRAEKVGGQVGEVNVSKRVTEEEQSLDVPVTREDVEIRRTPVDRPAAAGDAAFNEGEAIGVPVMAERVEVSKEPRVVEELEVAKTRRQDVERVSDTVRREQVDLDPSGDVKVRQAAVPAGSSRNESTAEEFDRDDVSRRPTR